MVATIVPEPLFRFATFSTSDASSSRIPTLASTEACFVLPVLHEHVFSAERLLASIGSTGGYRTLSGMGGWAEAPDVLEKVGDGEEEGVSVECASRWDEEAEDMRVFWQEAGQPVAGPSRSEAFQVSGSGGPC
jgi:hypothetical protein